MTQPASTKRAVLLVVDSVGVGALPDAKDYNDPPQANTLAHVAQACRGLDLPTLQAMGLGQILPLEGVPPSPSPSAAFGRMAARAPGKDTTTGHWEMAGLILQQPLALFPQGFPPSILEPFSQQTGRGILGNKPASGTQIIEELGPAHQQSGDWIVYTSADSVFQIAAHEETIPLGELYRACEIARSLLDPYHVGRVIARPFVGSPGAYQRTYHRKDFAFPPPGPTVLDHLQQAHIPVTGVGKIENIFCGQGLSDSVHTEGNEDGMNQTLALVQNQRKGLIFVNLVDFDMRYGHRNDPQGYGAALEQFDRDLQRLLPALAPQDLLLITADHGCDPTVPGTDHTREYVPLLAHHPHLAPGTPCGTRETFADVAQTLASFFALPPLPVGRDLAQP